MKKKKGIVILSVFTVLLVLGIVFGCVSLDDGQLGVVDYIAYPKAISLGLDLKGGVSAVFSAEKEEGMTTEDYENKLEGTAIGLRDLLFSKGYTEAIVSTTPNDGLIRIEVPDVDDPERLFDLIGKPATLEFKETEDSEVLVSGADLKEASVGLDQNGKYVVQIQFNSEGTKKFAEATSALQGKQLGIYIGGVLKLAPTVENAITDGKAQISNGQSGYSYDEAYELAVSIQSGAFALELNLRESKIISPTLGSDAINTGLISGLLGIAFIIIFLCLKYRMMGVAASLSLLFYTITYLFFMAIFPFVQLTLAGIAGVLLSIGMAVDANVIIFERIKEERLTNKPISSSVNIGFKKSLSAILDGNVTTLLGAFVLLAFGAATIKGFAITLIIGIIISLFSALLVTRVILKACFLQFNNTSDKLYGLKNSAMVKEKEKEEALSTDDVAVGGNA